MVEACTVEGWYIQGKYAEAAELLWMETMVCLIFISHQQEAVKARSSQFKDPRSTASDEMSRFCIAGNVSNMPGT